eukprot:3782764-Amphidinium_carterae.1
MGTTPIRAIPDPTKGVIKAGEDGNLFTQHEPTGFEQQLIQVEGHSHSSSATFSPNLWGWEQLPPAYPIT